MRINFTLYPDAVQRLQDTGLIERIEATSRKDNYPDIYGAFFESDAPLEIERMKRRGYFKSAPKGIRADYTSKVDAFFKSTSTHFWQVEKPSGTEREPSEMEDFPIISGANASYILKPSEFWDFERFGFRSVFEMIGVIGAYMKESRHKTHREGHVWRSESDGAQFVSEVTGSEHGDFRLFRTDVTPYTTTDPLGAQVSYRPELRSDRQMVSGYHSVESYLLGLIMRYVDQHKIPSKLLADNAKLLFDEARKMAQYVGPFADFGSGIGNLPPSVFNYDEPLVVLDENNRTDKANFERIPTSSNGYYYGFYVGHDRNIKFAYENVDKNPDPQKHVSLAIPAGEVDNLIIGLFQQSSRGLGRTSIEELTNVLEYRYGTKFDDFKHR